MTHFLSQAITDIGLKRQMNQDAYFKDDELGLYIVADGMGGHKGGEVASNLAVNSIAEYFKGSNRFLKKELLEESISMACHKIYDTSQAR